MSNYPYAQDNNITLPGVSGLSQEDIAINALREATFAIEKELGIVPSGIYSDVRARLDILESRINYGIPSNILNDGYILSPLLLWNDIQQVTLTISDGYGAPTENRVDGSLYLRADGYANNDFYIRRDGYWVPIQTEVFAASGDLMGDHLSQTVIGLYNHPLNPAMDTIDGYEDGYHLTWNYADGYWEAQTGFIAGSDLAADSAYFGRIGQKVIRIQNRSISPAAPGGTDDTDGDALIWNSLTTLWEPQPRAIIFDGYVARTNIRANRDTLQSPIDNTKVGIVNLSSRSTGPTTGATGNYSAILSGDRNTASGDFSLIAGGSLSIASDGYSSIFNGNSNVASFPYATVLNGATNQAGQNYALVLDGYSHVADGINSFIVNGGSNEAHANFSGVLNGISNTISSGALHAGIGWGTTNQITGSATYAYILGGSGNQTSAANTFLGTGTGSNIQSTYSVILNGLTNTVATSSSFALIGTGTTITVTGSYATVINGTGNTVNGTHATVVNGNTNDVTGNYSTIVNGNDNTISSALHAVIVDGYQNTISGSNSFIGDGYLNSISGIFSSIVNGNNNTISSAYSSILNGSNNTLNSSSSASTILSGIGNTLTGSTQSLVLGNTNDLSAALILSIGNFNTVSATQVRVFGSNNVITSAWSNVFGSANVIDGSLGYNHIFGASNTTGANSGHNLVVGTNNNVDGYHSVVTGDYNEVTSDGYFSVAQGRYAQTRVASQVSQAASNFNGTTAGEAQFSRVVLTGSGDAGIEFQALVPGDGYLTFEDGKAYDMNIRVLIVNNQNPLVDPTQPARFVYDILASQEGGTLTLHDVNNTITNQNGTGWTITIIAVSNQLVITVDKATFPQSPVPFNNSDRRVIATVEWREITRA